MSAHIEDTDRLSDILQVNTADVSGGAEMVSLELHRRFLGAGMTATLAVGWKHTNEPGVVAIPHDRYRSRWARLIGTSWAPGPLGTLRRAVAEPYRYAARLLGHEDFGFPGTSRIDTLAPHPPQILHLHNLHGGYFDVRALPELTRRYPTVYSPHDPWILSGHCAHPITCERWKRGCGTCPDLGRYVPIRRDASHENWSMKQAALAGSRLYLCSPSQWMLAMFLQSEHAASFIEARVIPNGIDPVVFTPGDKAQARVRLGLPNDETILVTTARATDANDFKGAEVLAEALQHASAQARNTVRVLTLGDTTPPRTAGRFAIESVPYTANRHRIADYLRAADLYVQPSRAESYSLVVAESLACGTPVLASDVGGTPEVVAGNRGALLFRSEDSEALSSALSGLLDDRTRLETLATYARENASRCYTLDQQARAYLDWYAEIFATHSRMNTRETQPQQP